MLDALAASAESAEGGAPSPLRLLMTSEARSGSSAKRRAHADSDGRLRWRAECTDAADDFEHDPVPGYRSSMTRIYQYDYERRTPARPPEHGELPQREDEDDGDPHHDMGLLTLIPRASCAGLDVLLPNAHHATAAHATSAHAARAHATNWQRVGVSDPRWLPIEKLMGDNEAVLFGGLTLARLAGVPALYHRVKLQAVRRVSAPYFLRGSLRVVLPRSPGHVAEEVADYHDALRDTTPCDEIRPEDGTIVRHSGRGRRPPSPRSPSPRRPYSRRRHGHGP